MEQKKIDRINELARKVKGGDCLTDEETRERDTLRREFIDDFKKNITAQLDNIYVVDEDGNKKKIRPKKIRPKKE